MPDLPKFVEVHEEGPRDGLQIEKTFIPTETKLKFIEALSATGLKEMQVTSFVRPDLVPQMADAEDIAASFTPKPRRTLYCPLSEREGAAAGPGDEEVSRQGAP